MIEAINRTTPRLPRRTSRKGAAFVLCCQLIITTPVLGREAVIVPTDSNTRITVENAVIANGETRVFFVSWPYLGDPQSGKPCPLNYYAVTVRPGLSAPRLEKVATGVCGGLIQNSALQADGTASVIIGDRWERWQGGKQLDSKALASLKALSSLGFGDTASLPENFEPAPNGDLIATVFSVSADRDNAIGGALNVARLAPNGEPRWSSGPEGAVAGVLEARIWAGPGEGALIYAVSPAMGNALLAYDPQGGYSRHDLASGDPMLAMDNLGQMDPQQTQAFFQGLADSEAETIEKIAARPAPGGGWYVLYQRRGGQDREGDFLLRLAADGSPRSEAKLGAGMASLGVEDWYDFYVEGSDLLVLSRAMATQKIINGRPKARAQNIVSWIDLASGTVSPYLVPLDDRYLDAALAAGDAEIQYLDGLPDSQPALLTQLGDHPLVVSVGWVERRQVLRLQEASQELKPFTEVMEKRQAQQARAAAREHRKTEREAQRENLLASQAEAAGMSVEEFQTLSKDEQSEAIIRNGGADQLLQSMLQQSEQQIPQRQAREAANQTAAPPAQFDAQLATAMAEAQREMANLPGMTPEMAAQMQAAMAQMSQGLGSGMPPSPATPAASDDASAPDEAGEILALDPAGRAFVEFDDDAGQPLTLRIFERASKVDLFRKDYADGVVYEYIDFTGFGLPLDRVRIQFLDSQGSVLRELIPQVQP